MPDRWDAEARAIVVVEPDDEGCDQPIGWRVALVAGHQRSTVIALPLESACDAYAEWLRTNIFAPLARRAYREGLERGAVKAEDECGRVAGHPLGCDIAAAIRREIEGGQARYVSP